MKNWVYILLMLCCMNVSAQRVPRDSVQIFFRQGKWSIDTAYRANGDSLSRFVECVKPHLQDSAYRLKRVRVISSASPEGAFALNDSLSVWRARSFLSYMQSFVPVGHHQLEVVSLGADWKGLQLLADGASALPFRTDVLELLQRNLPDAGRLQELKRLKGGVPYRWMYNRLFPLLRTSLCVFEYELKESHRAFVPVVRCFSLAEACPPMPDSLAVEAPEPVNEKRHTLHFALKTNGLYDLALIPNIGVEVYTPGRWSVAANWMYAWWSNRGDNNFWRIYGGDVEVRRWFGRKAEESPLQGHHIGVYGQMLTYDFECGGRGYLGDKWSYAFGVSYGYSLPIARRLHLDFSLGIGYLGGEYKEYLPIEGHYVWQSTKDRNWWGPTKAEVSLVWLLGKTDIKIRKGGTR